MFYSKYLDSKVESKSNCLRYILLIKQFWISFINNINVGINLSTKMKEELWPCKFADLVSRRKRMVATNSKSIKSGHSRI